MFHKWSRSLTMQRGVFNLVSQHHPTVRSGGKVYNEWINEAHTCLERNDFATMIPNIFVLSIYCNWYLKNKTPKICFGFRFVLQKFPFVILKSIFSLKPYRTNFKWRWIENLRRGSHQIAPPPSLKGQYWSSIVYIWMETLSFNKAFSLWDMIYDFF